MNPPKGLLLDSDVLAEIRRANPDSRVLAFLRRRSFRTFYISVLSLGELKNLYPYPETDRWLEELLDRFDNHVLEVDSKVTLEWAGRQASGRHALESGAALPTAALEGLMGATAIVHKLEIISSKAEIYRGWGVPATNPFIED